MKRMWLVAIGLCVLLVITFLVCIQQGVFASRSAAPMSKPDYTEAGWTIPIFISSADRSAELFHDWARLEQQSGYGLAQVEVYCRGWTPAFMEASTVEQFLALGEYDCLVQRITIRSLPDAAALGLAWDGNRVLHLLRYLDKAGVEGLVDVDAEAVLADLAAGRTFVLNANLEASSEQGGK